mgnify:CR=1 FL=1
MEANTKQVIGDLISAYLSAPNDTDVELRGCKDPENGRRAILLTFGTNAFVLSASAAMALAEGFEHGMQVTGDTSVANLIMGLRAAAEAIGHA